MSQIQALDKRVSFGMLVKGLGDRLKGIMAKAMTAEEKLEAILAQMEIDVQEKRTMARSIRSKMVALSDPETATLEPLERLAAQRKKLVTSGANLMKELEAATTPEVKETKTAQMNQRAREIKSLDTQLNSMQITYDALKESYEIALENYKVSQAAYDHAKNNGQGMLFAIKAHQDALSIRDNTRRGNSTVNDSSFLNDLEQELTKAQGELRSDKEIDSQLDNDTGLSPIAEEAADDAILEEFKKS